MIISMNLSDRGSAPVGLCQILWSAKFLIFKIVMFAKESVRAKPAWHNFKGSARAKPAWHNFHL